MFNINDSVAVFSGTSHPELAQEIVDHLEISLSAIKIERFPDGEISAQLLENVRGRDVFIIQTVALSPNEYLMELLIIADALIRSSARSITAVIPYFGYSRQDKKDKPRVPITAKLVANLLVKAGINRILTMDLHTGQVQGFFDVPVDNLYGYPPLLSHITDARSGLSNCVVVAPDLGGIKLARAYANRLGVDFAVVDKRRVSSTEVEAMTLIGDVKGKDVLLADDMCSTGATLVSAAKACREEGASRILAVATHGLFVGNALESIEKSPIEALFVSNTIPCADKIAASTKIRLVSVAGLFAQAIHRIISQESISTLFEPASSQKL